MEPVDEEPFAADEDDCFLEGELVQVGEDVLQYLDNV